MPPRDLDPLLERESGQAWMGGTTWHGVAAMRISVSAWQTTQADIDRTAAASVSAIGPGQRRPRWASLIPAYEPPSMTGRHPTSGVKSTFNLWSARQKLARSAAMITRILKVL